MLAIVGIMVLPLWAVHIADGILTWPWLALGFLITALLMVWGAWGIHEDEIPRVALLTAAFFVSSAIHIKVGPTSAHLLFSGLVGVLLGRRAALAIPVGLVMQALLFLHGGLFALGVNSVIMTLPALFAWQLFALMHRLPGLRRTGPRAVLVGGSIFLWILGLVYCLTLLFQDDLGELSWPFHLLTLAGAFVLAALAALLESRLENAPEFPLGLLVGVITVLATIALNSVVLLMNGQQLVAGGELPVLAEWFGVPGMPSATGGSSYQAWRLLVLLLFLAHLPIALVEGMVLGFTVGFLARVKPALLTGPLQEALPETDGIAHRPPLPCPAVEISNGAARKEPFDPFQSP